MRFPWESFVKGVPSLDVPGLETVDIHDRAMERRIVRKQDLRIMPWICLSYLLSTHNLDEFFRVGFLIANTSLKRLLGPSKSRQRTHFE